MTPKEKAKDLWWRFFNAQSTEENENLDGGIAYQCALIAADEIFYFIMNSENSTIYEIEYWIEVKQEIEKL
jgi:hypothetical protein